MTNTGGSILAQRAPHKASIDAACDMPVTGKPTATASVTKSKTPHSSQGASKTRTFRAMVALYWPLWPLVVGLAFGRAGLIVASYGSYTSTDEGIFTDGAMLVALSILAIFFLVILVRKKTFSKPTVNRGMRLCITLEALCLIGMSVLDLTGDQNPGVRFTLSSLCTLVSSGAIFYWLRRARGTGTAVAAVFVFSALILSEVEIYFLTLIPVVAGNLIATALVIVQFPCMVWARKTMQPYSITSPRQADDYFGFTKALIQDKRFLIATALGIGFLSIVIGLLRGYPNGSSIAFTETTRAAYALLTIGICASIIAFSLMRRRRVLTVYIFITMELLACLALVAHAAFPGMLDIGAVFTTTLNALMVGFTWYVVIAFMSYGWRDPYYYAIAGWLVWLGARALARMALLEVYTLSINDTLMNALMGFFILVSAQIIFVQFLNIAHHTAEESEASKEQSPSRLAKIMGLDEHENLASMRQASMQHNAEELGKQFLLSEREMEVLSLYALGYTQKRVAEELFITQGTAHAHIKRIYAKTGLHSRQEILDYMQKYTS